MSARLAALCVCCALIVVACSSTTVTSRATPHTASPGAASSSSPHSASLSGCPAPVSLPSLHVLAHVTGDPDDITAAPDGDLWLSDRDGERILQLSATGSVRHTYFDRNGPEGIVVLDDGKLIVAQQLPNRLDIFDPSTATFNPWLELGATAAPTDGVDGITRDGASILVPDSAQGRLLRVNIDARDTAGAPAVLATGLGRPVDAAAAGDGSVFVALENQPGLARITPPSIAVIQVASFDSLDDLVLMNGLLYATDLADHSVAAIDPASGGWRTLVSDATAPQGLTLTGGQVLVVDSTAQLVAALPLCR